MRRSYYKQISFSLARFLQITQIFFYNIYSSLKERRTHDLFSLLSETSGNLNKSLFPPKTPLSYCWGCSRISAEPIYHSLVLEFYAGLVLHWVRLTNYFAEIISRSYVLKDCNFNLLIEVKKILSDFLCSISC